MAENGREHLFNVNVYVVNHYFTKQDLEKIGTTLNDKRGFGSIANFKVQVTSQKYYMAKEATPSIVVLAKLSKEEIKNIFGVNKREPESKQIYNMSFTYLYLKPPVIVFNADNWDKHPPKFKGTQEDYLTYLINHEFGHALSLEHEKKTKQLCPLMYQQTLGTETCLESTPWPSKQNLDQAIEYLTQY